jgi:hypothetical protein
MRGFVRAVKLIYCKVLDDYTRFGLALGIIEDSQLATELSKRYHYFTHTAIH